MAGYTKRAYKGNATATTLTASMSNVATSCTIAAYTGWPYGSDPFYVVVSPGTAAEEKVLVTRTGSTDTTLNVVSGGRGADDTTAQSHDSGAAIYPVFTAVDAAEANTVASTLTTKGDLLVHTGSVHARLGVGTNGYALVADSAETNGVKWAVIDDTTKIAKSIVDAKGDLIVATAADTVARVAVGATANHVLVVDSGEAAGVKWQGAQEVIVVALSDETTAIATGTSVVTFRMPFAMTLTAVRASLSTASTSGTPTFDINEGGSTILSTKITIDANEKTSTTAATAAVISDTALADDAEMTVDIDVAGTGAKGAKVYLIGRRA
jgi:hypothetical protein